MPARPMLRARAGLEHPMAHPHGFRRHLDQLFLIDPFKREVERHFADGREPDCLIVSGGADIGQFFLAAYIDSEINLARVLAEDHALVDRLARFDEKAAAFLQMENRVTRRDTFAVRDHTAILARPDGTVPGSVAVENRMRDAGAARLGKKLAAKSDQPA